MAQTHHMFQLLDAAHGKKSLAYWSTVAASHCVIFVHGFGGKPHTTWPDFADLLPRRPELPPFDYLFYGYDGLRQQSANSASGLLGFLDRFLGAPAALVNATSPAAEKRPPFTYQRVILAAHSLGAVVTRRALLDAHRLVHESGRSMPWLPGVRLVLFAPAHRGAFAARLASVALLDQPRPLAKLAGAFAHFNSPLLDELQEDSPMLRRLAEETLAVAASTASPPDYVKAWRILRGERDNVVSNQPFGVDPPVPPEDVLDTGHTGVCKPRQLDHRALDAVWSAM